MKTTYATRPSSSFKVFLGVVLTICAFTAVADAKPSFVGKVTLPYEVRWGRAVLPAGVYFIQMETAGTPALIRSASGTGLAAYTQSPSVADAEKDGTYLTITAEGNGHRVRSMNVRELNKMVVFAPLTKREKEAFAKAGEISKLPVIIARK